MINFHPYQQKTIDRAVDHLFVRDRPGFGILADPGLGKTLMTLEIFRQLRELGQFSRALIVAPLRVIYSVWQQEADKWGYDFDIVNLHGNPSKRKHRIESDADINLINPESLLPLIQHGRCPWDVICVDESTKFKNWSAKRSVALRQLIQHIPKRLILTGTPAPNSLLDVFSQTYILDDGAALGKNITVFRARFAHQGGYLGRRWIFNHGMEDQLYETLGDMVVRLDCRDHLDMPRLVRNHVWVDLAEPIMAEYRRLERALFLELEDGVELIASSAGAKHAMCRQLANGGVYENLEGGEREIHHMHEQKVDATEEIIDELSGKPVIVAYQFVHDLIRLKKRFSKASVINGRVSSRDGAQIIENWKRGKVDVLLVQCQAMSHGIDGLQGRGNDVIWFGPTDQPEIHTQLNARLWRQGQREDQVRIHYVLARNTIDEATIKGLQEKDATQAGMLRALKEYQLKKMGERVLT